MMSDSALSPIRVVVIAEGADAAEIAQRCAAAGCTVSVADGGPGAVDVVRRAVPDVVVLGREHLSFPDRLRALRPDRYPVFLFASVGTEALLQALNSRAAGVGGWVPHPNTFHRTASSPIATV
jgi:hypothetical protein